MSCSIGNGRNAKPSHILRGNAVDSAQDILGDIDTEIDKADQQLTVRQNSSEQGKVLDCTEENS